MIEEIIIQYLSGKGLSVGSHIYAEVPEDPPDAYVVIEKTGSSRVNRINQAMIAIQSIVRKREDGRGMLMAARLNEEVKAAMDEIIALPQIFKCALNSDYNFTNTATKEYRYQAVFNLYY